MTCSFLKGFVAFILANSILSLIFSQEHYHEIRIVENGSEALLNALKDRNIGISEADAIINTWGGNLKEQDYCVEICKNIPQGYKKDIIREIKSKNICSTREKSFPEMRISRMITDMEHSLQDFMNIDIKNPNDIRVILELCQAICRKYA